MRAPLCDTESFRGRDHPRVYVCTCVRKLRAGQQAMASQKITSFFGKRVSPASTQVEASKKRPRLVGEASTATESTSSSARASVDASGSVSSVVPAKHKTGYDPRWEKKFPWVYLADDGLGMYCRLCRRFNTRNERNRSAVFNETSCVSLHNFQSIHFADYHCGKIS